ncbi:sigma-70 family RNA polymerase sigma factor [Vagococcus zengguangii]|uniref:Sigma-70 family RNA polymerase sigma factor n=1 Tax=Vagococcus zengguangii TaxID=2571750 RepID=A0A4D7CUH5_9ENTE|nr:sigma-70 family RNA polymerase sigma factor [Vagococcus zengguangii]QCI86993.1 sigma-70 family RNA polymerase sigma factor [Vagococcus zengguangii]
MITTTNEQQFETYEPIIYGVLKSLNIHYYASHYEDLVQQARLILWELLQTRDPRELTDEEHHQFNGFLYQRIRWRLIDLLRRDNQLHHHFEHYQPLEEIQEVSCLPTNPYISSVKELLHVEWPTLPSHLQTYLIATVDYQLTVSELARCLGVSRQTLYTWRKQLQHYLINWQST